MSIENGYDQWAETYDSTSNKTRDLDLVASKTALEATKFQSVLEVGCGTGKNTEWLVRRCTRLVAVDFSAEMLAIAKKKVTDLNVEWNRFDISRTWPIQQHSFDLITFNLVLEHVQDLNAVIAEAASRLTNDGHIYISELHPFKQYLGSGARFDTENGTQKLEVFTHHISDFVKALADAGLRIKELNEWFDSDVAGVPRLLTILASSDRLSS